MATLDVPASTLSRVSRWLTDYRKTHDTRPWQRAATPYLQAAMVLRRFTDDADVAILARDARISIATAYRYLHEAVDVIAANAPELRDVLARGLREGWALVCLDGTLISCTRSSAPSEAGHDIWYSGKHKQHGGSVQVVTGPEGYPEWVSEVEAGSTLKGRNLAPDNLVRNLLISSLRAPAERANALLKRTWKALERITLEPWRIGAITAAPSCYSRATPPPTTRPGRRPH